MKMRRSSTDGLYYGSVGAHVKVVVMLLDGRWTYTIKMVGDAHPPCDYATFQEAQLAMRVHLRSILEQALAEV